jgi:hypothetical protein
MRPTSATSQEEELNHVQIGDWDEEAEEEEEEEEEAEDEELVRV